MSVPRILLAPTHQTALAGFLASAFAEVIGLKERRVRYHHLGAVCPSAVWDRWEGSSFLDPVLYGEDVLVSLYERTVRGADISVLATDRGLLDEGASNSWSPASIARSLDCPLVLVLDCRGWGTGLGALVQGFNERMAGANLAGLLLTGVRDQSHRNRLRRALTGAPAPVVGCLYAGDGPGWETSAPGPASLPLAPELLEKVHRQVDTAGLEAIAGQRGFLPASTSAKERETTGPLVMVAGGEGFTPWSRDSIEVLRVTGARVRRLDLCHDEHLPEDTAGLVVAGHAWPDTLGDLAANYSLMREIRVKVSEGLPTLALGGGMLYFMRRVQDVLGRTHELAGVLPAEAEVLGDLEEPAYLEVKAERDTLLLSAGESAIGWVTADVEIMEAPVSRGFPFSVMGEGWPARLSEGAATGSLLCSRVLVHLASRPQGARRFLVACATYDSGLSR